MTREQKEFRKLANQLRELRGIKYPAPPRGGAQIIPLTRKQPKGRTKCFAES
jgi:hypothetical protein